MHLLLYTQLKIAQVVTALLVEQCRVTTRFSIMAEQCCSTNNVVHYCFNNVVERTVLFTIVSTMMFSIDEATTVVEIGENNIDQ